jgi:hypothetical protein
MFYAETVSARSVMRAFSMVVSGLFLALLARDLIDVAIHWDQARGSLGADYNLYIGAARRWLGGGGFYLPQQLSGPYVVIAPAVLYPPTALLLFIPFTVLPASLWWAIPVGIIGWAIWHHRPGPLVWPILAMCLWIPTTSEVLFAGNPAVWVVAAVALGTVYGWPAVLAIIKPTLAPFALIGMNRRSWWLAGAGLAAVSFAFAPMWRDYVLVLLNARDPLGPLYSLNQVPTLMLPIVAWLGSGKRASRMVAVGPVAEARPLA